MYGAVTMTEKISVPAEQFTNNSIREWLGENMPQATIKAEHLRPMVFGFNMGPAENQWENKTDDIVLPPASMPIVNFNVFFDDIKDAVFFKTVWGGTISITWDKDDGTL